MGQVHEFWYNARSELIQESHVDIGTVVYGYDKNGNRKSRTQGGVTEWLRYDGNNKLVLRQGKTESSPDARPKM